ncbi:hypothetical protein ABZW10_33975 [Kitasatospora sp. NPDC004723]|uniref:hypothetical protein n=1 Tax=Kitasatospora sp. NPDC004723 TaxID=3154288 RepID=UPI0033B9DD5B
MGAIKWNKSAIDRSMREFQREINRHAIKVAIGADLNGADGGLEEDPVLSKALLWLDERAAQQPSYYQDFVVFAEREGTPVGEAENIALQLEQHGFVRRAPTMVPDATAILTDEGRVEVGRLKKLAGDRAARANYASNAVLRWLYDHDAPVKPDDFAAAPTAFFAGAALRANEITGAVTELVGHGLVEREADQAGTDLDRLRITAAGTACIRSGHTVRSYMDSQNTATTTNNYHGSTVVHGEVNGGVISTGDHNTINAGNGIDAQALAGLVQGLRDVAPQLGLDPVDAEDYAADVEALERDGRNPEQGARIWRRLMRLAGPALTTTVATGVGQQLVELGTGLYN